MNEIENTAVVYRTTDYDKFKKLIGNRDVGIRGQKIKAKIQKVGYVLNPIVVNEKMEVIDGQGRLDALSSLKMPVDYVIAKGAGLKECQEMNLGTSNWSMTDFVNSYAEMGNPDYIRLKQTINKYKMFTWKVIYNICNSNYGDSGGASYNNVNEGTFEYSEKNKIRVENVLERLKEFISISKKIGGRREQFLFAISFCLDKELVSDEELLKKIKEKVNDISPAATVRHCLEDIERAYNYRRRDKVYITHEYELLKDESNYIRKKAKRVKG